uniref:Uncharacterized protein n=1 Tax=Anguilla anguilla TaxID=7936 RepID=A0A0E9V1M5_ANGAN
MRYRGFETILLYQVKHKSGQYKWDSRCSAKIVLPEPRGYLKPYFYLMVKIQHQFYMFTCLQDVIL